MADRLGAGFVAVIDEIPLRVALRVLSQDLHAVLVRPDRPVRAETEEQRPGYAGRLDFEARSEEHTSELQSLMRTSYAVFCLKKKKKPQQSVEYKNTHTIQLQ